MEEEGATSQGPKRPKSDLIIPPTMVARGSSKARPRRAAKESKRVGISGYLALVALSLLAFGPILNSEFLWTEYDEIERTPYLSMDSWTEAWSVQMIRQHDPITLTTYFFESKLPLPTATTHRLINLFLHLFAALLLLKILESLKLRGAFAAALVFALHPAALQTLLWPGYRSELVALVFIFASLFFGVRNRDLKDFILTVVLTCISSLLHSAALVLPAVIAFCIFFKSKSFHLHHYNRVLPLCCVALFAGVWTHSGQSADHAGEELNLLTTAGQNLYFYLQQSFFPFDLHLFHQFSERQSYNVGAANSLVAFIIFIPFYVLIGFNFHKRWARGLFLGLSSFILLLICGITQTGRFIDGSLAKEEHALYVALPAAVAIVFCSVAGFFGQRKVLGKFLWRAFFGLFLLIQVGLTTSYSLSVNKTAEMWQTMSEQWENSWQPKAALVESVITTESDLLSEAEIIRTLEDILEINPALHRERILLARYLREAGQNTNALTQYRRILRETNPDDAFLAEAADLFDMMNLRWEATNTRERITQSAASKK